MKVMTAFSSALPALKVFPLSVVASSFPFSPLEKATLKDTFFPSCTFVLQDSKVNSNVRSINNFVFIKHLLVF